MMHLSWGNWRLKEQWDPTIHLLEEQKSKKLKIQIIAEDAMNRNSFIDHSTTNGADTLEDCSAVSYKAKHYLTMQYSNCPSKCLSNWFEK